MFVIYREYYDSLEETRLCVTDSEANAKAFVEAATQELSAAAAVPVPTWAIDDIKKFGTDYMLSLRTEYEAKVNSLIKTDIDLTLTYYGGGTSCLSYHYEPIRVLP